MVEGGVASSDRPRSSQGVSRRARRGAGRVRGLVAGVDWREQRLL